MVLEVNELVERALKNDRLSIGRLLTLVERDPRKAGEILSILPDNDEYHVIGVTGIPGSGKSTLLSKLLSRYSERGFRCGVVAIDPSSMFSRGALLGDRIRMQAHATNPNIFIRSVATRGLKGGLSFAGVAMIDVFGRLGFNKVFVESIGVGQADVDIMGIADTILVVTVPGLGDDIQALKAGVMEIGDIYVINKVDKMPEEANKTYEYLKFAIESGELGGDGWSPKIVKISAVMDMGIDDLVKLVEEHYNFLKSSKKINTKRVNRRRILVRLLAEKIFIDGLDRIDYTPSSENLYHDALKVLRSVLSSLEESESN